MNYPVLMELASQREAEMSARARTGGRARAHALTRRLRTKPERA